MVIVKWQKGVRKTKDKTRENNTILPSKLVEYFLDYMRECQ